jgi:thioredoxin-related protein
MKNNFMKVLALLSILFIAACGNNEQTNQADQENIALTEIANPKLKLQIYYFHGTNRCATCNSIETAVKEVVDSNFKEQLASGIVNFKTINVDEAENKILAKKYEAAGAALHFVQIENGTETDNDLTEYAFSNVRTQPDLFKSVLKEKIQSIIQ